MEAFCHKEIQHKRTVQNKVYGFPPLPTNAHICIHIHTYFPCVTNFPRVNRRQIKSQELFFSIIRYREMHNNNTVGWKSYQNTSSIKFRL